MEVIYNGTLSVWTQAQSKPPAGIALESCVCEHYTQNPGRKPPCWAGRENMSVFRSACLSGFAELSANVRYFFLPNFSSGALDEFFKPTTVYLYEYGFYGIILR